LSKEKIEKDGNETPLMKQYNQIKAKHPQALLLFRVGDFYETFGEDAVKASKILGIVLTKRRNGSSHIELAGFPHHSMDNYLPKLVRAGQRVAICDQLEDPKMTKTIVKRGVTELVTPGIALMIRYWMRQKTIFCVRFIFQKMFMVFPLLMYLQVNIWLHKGRWITLKKLSKVLSQVKLFIKKNIQVYTKNYLENVIIPIV
jgi:DNA mismatch repair protein MutS